MCVREAEMHIGIAEIVAGNNDLSSRTEQQAASLAQTAPVWRINRHGRAKRR